MSADSGLRPGAEAPEPAPRLRVEADERFAVLAMEPARFIDNLAQDNQRRLGPIPGTLASLAAGTTSMKKSYRPPSVNTPLQPCFTNPE